MEPALTLCVDMDGTLIVGDTLWQSIVSLLRTSPLQLLLLPFWLVRGKAYLKARVAAQVIPDPAALLYRLEIIEYLKGQRAIGARIVLATAANYRVAKTVAAHLGIFDGVLASDDQRNLAGKEKVRAIRAYLGGDGYRYIGNSRADIPIWRDASEALLVRPSPGLLASVSENAKVVGVFNGGGEGLLRSMWRTLRPHHWAKNLLLAVPLITSHRVGDIGSLRAVLWAMVSFSLAASSAYIINDIMDAEFDRCHAGKRSRPIASGALGTAAAAALAALSFLVSIALALALLPPAFAAAIFVYVAATTAYSLYIRSLAILDVILLAGFYMLRVIAGGLVIGITLSPWLLAFSMFEFLSLAFVKRYSEIAQNPAGASSSNPGRGYLAEDKQLLGFSGIASGYMAVMVFALYIDNSPDVPLLYRRPQLLWSVCPLLLYWIHRVWLLTFRGGKLEDPIVFILKDRTSYCVGFVIALILILAL